MNNTLTLVGHVGQAPQVKVFGNTGSKVAKFSIAVKEYSSNAEATTTIWIDVDAWGNVAERVIQTITKGREVVLTGRLSINSFEKTVDGVVHKVSKPVMKLTSFHLCGKKPVAQESPEPEPAPAPAPKPKKKAA
ncbi:MAG: single-stranded DNA-binding protein [Candidatus Melainabacteria bacterium]|nr:single-stranded DNA-binding protein [Candidatus Melainabacteria bacterium]